MKIEYLIGKIISDLTIASIDFNSYVVKKKRR